MEPDVEGRRRLREPVPRFHLGLEPERVGGAPVDRRATGDAEEVTPEEADARQFEERLNHGIKEGSFYTLLVNPKYYQRAAQEALQPFPDRARRFRGAVLGRLT